MNTNRKPVPFTPDLFQGIGVVLVGLIVGVAAAASLIG